MIIISQDKTMILNFEYIETIEIENPLENNDGKFKILSDTTSDNQYTIAEYKTEERAKEVLKEIWEFYEVAKRYSSSNGMSMIFEKRFAYEMPEV